LLGGTDVSFDAEKSSGVSAGKFNIVAKSTTALGDVRCLSQEDLDQAKAKIREIIAASLPRTSAQISFEDVFLGWPVTDGNRAALKLLDVVSRDLGQGALEADDPAQRGAGDFGYIGSIVSGADGLGIRGQGFHSPEESAELKSLGPSTSRAAVAITRLVRPIQ
jgi:glutamate carboxypeptidase